MGPSPTREHATLLRSGCNEMYTKASRASYERDASRCLSVMLNAQGHIGSASKNRKLRKTRSPKLRLGNKAY